MGRLAERFACRATGDRSALAPTGLSLLLALEKPAARSPWQNGYAERVIGSIRRDCLDHVIVLGERQLKRVLSEYTDYYNRVRTHLSLEKDAPETRVSQTPEQGRVIRFPRVGGLHHEYSRMAA